MENTRSIYVDISTLLENPGIEFHPTDKELVGHYLTHKNNGEFIDDHISEVNVYNLHPFHLPEAASFTYTMGQERQLRWYYYMDKEFINDRDGNRIANGGYWKKKGAVKSIDGDEGVLIGEKQCFEFYMINSMGMKVQTDWLMHEYSLSHNPEGPFVLCRLLRHSSADLVELMDLSHGDDYPSLNS